MLRTYDDRLHMQGLSLDEYLKFTKKTMEDMENELKGEAAKNITYRYMIEEISNKENINATDEGVEEEIDRLAKLYQMIKEELISAFGDKEMIKYVLRMRRPIKFLKENN